MERSVDEIINTVASSNTMEERYPSKRHKSERRCLSQSNGRKRAGVGALGSFVSDRGIVGIVTFNTPFILSVSLSIT